MSRIAIPGCLPMLRLVALCLLPCLLCAGSAVAGARTFGLDSDQAALAARPRAEWVRQARMLEKHADWPGLLAWGQAWARVDADNPLAWFVQGRALGELGRFADAITAYRRNVQLAPGDVWARNNLGNAWRDSGHPREAMLAYRAAVEIDPDYLQAWHNLGLTFYLVQGQAGVTRALERLHATDPALAEAWRKLAVEYSLTRDERVAHEAARVLRGLSATRRARMFEHLFGD